jgi:hypothetical protein
MKISAAKKSALCRELQKIEATLFDQETPPRIVMMQGPYRFAADNQKKPTPQQRRQIAFYGAGMTSTVKFARSSQGSQCPSDEE